MKQLIFCSWMERWSSKTLACICCGQCECFHCWMSSQMCYSYQSGISSGWLGWLWGEDRD